MRFNNGFPTGAVEGTLEDSHPGGIIVVDDEPVNLKLMEKMLRLSGYEVRSFPRARLALQAAAQLPPELFLLDINMPEMDGFEACRRLKSDSLLGGIPVIFLSALSATEDKIKALRCGGVDYITKPFEFEEVRARVEAQLRLFRLSQELKKHTDHLEELVAARTAELMRTQERLKMLDCAKGEFLKVISKELRAPFNGFFGISAMVMENAGLGEASQNLRVLYQQSQRRIATILDDALLLTQLEADWENLTPRPVPLVSILTGATERASAIAQARNIKVQQGPDDLCLVQGRQDLLVKAIQALIEFGCKHAREGTRLRISSAHLENSTVRISIETTTGRISDIEISRMFEMSTEDEALETFNIGLPTAHRIITLFGGRIEVHSSVPEGIEIAVTLNRTRLKSTVGSVIADESYKSQSLTCSQSLIEQLNAT